MLGDSDTEMLVRGDIKMATFDSFQHGFVTYDIQRVLGWEVIFVELTITVTIVGNWQMHPVEFSMSNRLQIKLYDYQLGEY